MNVETINLLKERIAVLEKRLDAAEAEIKALEPNRQSHSDEESHGIQ